jgi:thiol-disulfide isomerase/thioredoxin
MTAVACNDIDEQDRFIEVSAVESNRVVLLEDYTGQRCTNCPDAHAVMEQLQEQYPNQIVCVSIHAGSFAIPASNATYVGLKQDFADDMATLRKVESYPSGAIDGASPYQYADWATVVRAAMAKPAYAEVTVDNLQYDAATSTLTGEVTILPGQTMSARLGIWLTESNITAMQVNHGDIVMNYVHNNVLRNHISESVWGDAISLEYGVTTTYSFSTSVQSTWVPENLSVVAFVVNAETGEYVQTAMRKMNAQ